MAEQIFPYLAALGFKILKIVLEGPSENAPVQDMANVMSDKTNTSLWDKKAKTIVALPASGLAFRTEVSKMR